jgi:NAD-dependent dihydropyrimidine dehydrogenase PreA subunit
MGAFLSCTSKINLFGLKIEKSKCNDCNQCISVCPNFSITKESLAAGKSLISCTKCGACIEKCPNNAINFNIKGVTSNPENRLLDDQYKIGVWKKFVNDIWDPAVVFIFGIFMLSTVLSSGNFSGSISRLLKYFIGI